MIAVWFNRPASKILFVCHQTGAFNHTVGGSPRHRGTTPQVGPPLHLFFEFDLRDPVLSLSIPGIGRLPLYYALRNSEGRLLYRLLAEDEIEIISQPYREEYVQADSWFNRPGFPVALPNHGVTLSETLPFGQHDQERHPEAFGESSGMSFGGRVFRHDGRNVVRAIPFGADELIEHWNQRASVTNAAIDPADFYNFLADADIFIQGPPSGDDECKNPACEHSGQSGSVQCLLLLQPEASDAFFDDLGGGSFGQLCFLICKSCRTIHAYNDCS